MRVISTYSEKIKNKSNVIFLLSSCGEVDPMYLSDGCFGITRFLDDIGNTI